MTTFTNGKVAICKDIFLGLSIYSEEGWVPFSSLESSDKDLVRKLLDFDPACPPDWRKEIYA